MIGCDEERNMHLLNEERAQIRQEITDISLLRDVLLQLSEDLSEFLDKDIIKTSHLRQCAELLIDGNKVVLERLDYAEDLCRRALGQDS